MKRKIKTILCSCLLAALVLPNQGTLLYAASDETVVQDQNTEELPETENMTEEEPDSDMENDGGVSDRVNDGWTEVVDSESAEAGEQENSIPEEVADEDIQISEEPEQAEHIERTSTEMYTVESPFKDVVIDDSLFTFEFVDEEGNTIIKERNIDSMRLIVAGEIADPENAIAQYDGLTLLQYADTELFKKAYSYYVQNADFVEIDTTIVADSDDYDVLNEQYTTSEMDMENNPLSELEEIMNEEEKAAEELPSEIQDYSGAVALIDTGVDDRSFPVFASVSMLGDDGKDESGHGTRMAELILGENPDAKLLSIKALGADGSGDLSTVISAIKYAMEKKVTVINLSMSTVRTESNSGLETVIKAAVEQGIQVVVSAGNNNKDTKYFTPACMEETIVAGSCTETGERAEFSNYGDSVDVNVVSYSTSAAAAILTGIISRDGKYEIDNVKLFDKGYVPQNGYEEEDTDVPDEGEDVTIENDPHYAPNDPLLNKFQQEVNEQKLYAAGLYNPMIISYNAPNKQKASTGAIKDDPDEQFTKKILKKALATSYQQPDKIKFSGQSGIWKIGYVPANNYYTASTKCRYILCPANSTQTFDNITIRFPGTNPYAKNNTENYDIYVAVNEIRNTSGKTTAFAIDTEGGFIGGAEEIYSDAGLKNRVSDQLYANDSGALYVNMTMKVTYKNSTDPEKEVPRLYSCIEDIDWGQCFYNHTAPFATGSNGNVFIESAALFDQDENGSGLFDYFYDVNGGSAPFTNAAIYAGINPNRPYEAQGYFGSPATANLYHKDSTLTSTRGSVQTWGWHHSAWSSIDVRSETYNIKYSSVHGTASPKTESVWAETTIAGSTNTPDSGYHAEKKPSKEDPDVVTEWTTDQAMYLSLKKLTIGGVSYPAYSILKSAQTSGLTSGTDYVYYKKDARIQMKTMKKIIVTKDLAFTAHNALNPKVTYSVEPSGSGTLSRTSETVDYGTNPKGSANTPKEGWSQNKAKDLPSDSLTCWTTDQELYIRKKASTGEITGDLLTAEEAAELATTQYLHYAKDARILMSVIKKIKVTEDLAFTAHNKKASAVRIYKWIDRGDEEALINQDFNIYVEYTKLVTDPETGADSPAAAHKTLRLGENNVDGGQGTEHDPYYWEIPYVARNTTVTATERNFKIADERYRGAVRIGTGSYTVMNKDAAGEYIAKAELRTGAADAENAIYFRNRYYPSYTIQIRKYFYNAKTSGMNISSELSSFNITANKTIKINGSAVSSLNLNNLTKVSNSGETLYWNVTVEDPKVTFTEHNYNPASTGLYECYRQQQRQKIDGAWSTYADGTSSVIDMETVTEGTPVVMFRNRYREKKPPEEEEHGDGTFVKTDTKKPGRGLQGAVIEVEKKTITHSYSRSWISSGYYTGNSETGYTWHDTSHWSSWSGPSDSSQTSTTSVTTGANGAVNYPTTANETNNVGSASGSSYSYKTYEYRAREVTAPQGYKIDSSGWKSFSHNGHVSFTDTPWEATVKVTKKDQSGNVVNVHPDGGSLSEESSAAFQIREYNKTTGQYYAYSYDGADSIQYATTGTVSFKIRYSSINQGRFRVVEVQAPEYYDEPAVEYYDITITADNQTIEKAFHNTKWGKISVKKDMEAGYDRSILDPNNAFSLEGAVYGIYESSAAAQSAADKGEPSGNEVEIFTTNAEGTGITTEGRNIVWLTTTKQYYVAEISASPGFLRNTTVGNITLTPGNETKAKIGGQNGIVEETPAVSDPIGIQKVDIENLDVPAVPEGFEAIDGLEVPNDFRKDLKGAQYTVEYYDTLFASISEVVGSPRRTWVFETDETGKIDMSDPATYKVSGDNMYYYDKNGTRKYVLPFGTYVISETLAPPGFDINEEKYMIRVGITNKNKVSRIVADAEGTKLSSEILTDDGVLSILRYTEPVSDVRLTIHKTILQGDLYHAGGHGVANFAFKIEGYTMIGEKKKWHTVIDFNSDPTYADGIFAQEDKTEATLSETITIPAGFYKITELETGRWALVDVAAPESEQLAVSKEGTGIRRNGISLITGYAAGLITDKENPHEVTFRNRKVDWQEYSHLDQIKNAIRVAEIEPPEEDEPEDEEP